MKEVRSEKAVQRGRAEMIAVGGVLGALAASSCCVFPLVLFTLGATGPWIGRLTALSPYKPYLLVGSVAAIGLGVFELRRRARGECSAGSCATPRRRFFAKSALTFAAALVMLNLVWPRILPLLFG
jgi:mercuric ion transport protein